MLDRQPVDVLDEPSLGRGRRGEHGWHCGEGYLSTWPIRSGKPAGWSRRWLGRRRSCWLSTGRSRAS